MIDQPDDVTVCEGGTALFTCVMNITNVNISEGDVKWWRARIDLDQSINVEIQESAGRYKVTNRINDQILNTTLMITDVISTLSGQYWPKLTGGNKLCRRARLSILNGHGIKLMCTCCA